jgi:pimeloyl-ACP methyl ester carboxylesterase
MEQIISKDGTVIAFRRSGAGQPLLLVHGATADHRRWSPILPQLEQQFSVCTMDRRGRGGNSASPDYDIMREAEDVAAVVEAIGEPVFILGHSYGVICSLEAALLTDKIGKLILYEPDVPTGVSPIPPVVMPEHELGTYRQFPMWKGRIRLAPTIPRELDIYRTYRFNPEKFASLQVPTMLLLGGDSPQLAWEAIELVDSTLPDSRVVILIGQQHIAMETNPELFAREVLHFLLE